jgi:hypothetical protein
MAKAIFFSIFFLGLQTWADIPTTQEEQERQAKLDDIVSSCTLQKKRDKICDSIITARQIGNDSVEFIKEYMDLPPYAYSMLTALNFLGTGRIRIKTKSSIFKKTDHIYDLQRDKITFIVERKF